MMVGMVVENICLGCLDVFEVMLCDVLDCCGVVVILLNKCIDDDVEGLFVGECCCVVLVCVLVWVE